MTRIFEAPKRERFAAELARAEQALARGELASAQAGADAALRSLPVSPEGARAAPLYDALARSFEARGQLSSALAALSRALRLAPEAAEATRRRARALFLEAELRLASGQVDLAAYERALALDPALHEAREALDELTGARHERERARRRLFGALAAAALLLAGVFVLRERRATSLGLGRAATACDAAGSGGPAQALPQRET